MKIYKVVPDKQKCIEDFEKYTNLMSKGTRTFLGVFVGILLVGILLFFILPLENKFIAESIILGSSISTILFLLKYILESTYPKKKIKQIIDEANSEFEIISVNEEILDATVFGHSFQTEWKDIKYANLIDDVLFLSRNRKEFPLRLNPTETGTELYEFAISKVEKTIVKN